MIVNGEKENKTIKTILLAFQRQEDRNLLIGILADEGYRIICADNFLSLIESFNNYCIDLLISEVYLPGISMIDFLPFLRQRYFEIKVIIAMKDYSPKLELRLRPYKITYVIQLPVSSDLLRSVVARGLEIDKIKLVCANR